MKNSKEYKALVAKRARMIEQLTTERNAGGRIISQLQEEIANLKEKMTDCKGTLTSVRVWLRDSIDGIVVSKDEQNALDCIKKLIEKVQKELTVK